MAFIQAQTDIPHGTDGPTPLDQLSGGKLSRATPPVGMLELRKTERAVHHDPKKPGYHEAKTDRFQRGAHAAEQSAQARRANIAEMERDRDPGVAWRDLLGRLQMQADHPAPSILERR